MDDRFCPATCHIGGLRLPHAKSSVCGRASEGSSQHWKIFRVTAPSPIWFSSHPPLTYHWVLTVAQILFHHPQEASTLIEQYLNRHNGEQREIWRERRRSRYIHSTPSFAYSRLTILVVLGYDPLIPPEFLALEHPALPNSIPTVLKGRKEAVDIIKQNDDRPTRNLRTMLTPRSRDSIRILQSRLVELASKLKDDLLIIMRAYLEKPRTTVGWKGSDQRSRYRRDVQDQQGPACES